ncbi:hypothetical protein SASPL_145403 [Salvia splendens]|uniref:Uncharacterized protein n=1 Tax=Salvia splendens TaxID=180675 RepID=A0A8X8Z821_SALSN|nr:hypothetical protein SASPL_145403 [Salvia splendens]
MVTHATTVQRQSAINGSGQALRVASGWRKLGERRRRGLEAVELQRRIIFEGLPETGFGGFVWLISNAEKMISDFPLEHLRCPLGGNIDTSSSVVVPGLWTQFPRRCKRGSLGNLKDYGSPSRDGLGISVLLTSNPSIQYTAFDPLKNRMLKEKMRKRESGAAAASPSPEALTTFLLGAVSKCIALFNDSIKLTNLSSSTRGALFINVVV